MNTQELDARALAKERVLAKLAEYARGRASDVACGAETAELAALLLQKYGYGLCDAFSLIFAEQAGESPTYADVDAAVIQIDPDWRAAANKRWAGRPAALTY